MLLLLFLVLPAVSSFSSVAYRYYAVNYPNVTNWYEANLTCKLWYNTYLGIISNEEQNNISSLLSANKTWIGWHKDKTSLNESAFFTNFKSSIINTSQCGYYDSLDGFWHTKSCDSKLYNISSFICHNNDYENDLNSKINDKRSFTKNVTNYPCPLPSCEYNICELVLGRLVVPFADCSENTLVSRDIENITLLESKLVNVKIVKKECDSFFKCISNVIIFTKNDVIANLEKNRALETDRRNKKVNQLPISGINYIIVDTLELVSVKVYFHDKIHHRYEDAIVNVTYYHTLDKIISVNISLSNEWVFNNNTTGICTNHRLQPPNCPLVTSTSANIRTKFSTKTPTKQPSQSVIKLSSEVECCITTKRSDVITYGGYCKQFVVPRNCRSEVLNTCKWCVGCRRRTECYITYLSSVGSVPNISPTMRPTVLSYISQSFLTQTNINPTIPNPACYAQASRNGICRDLDFNYKICKDEFCEYNETVEFCDLACKQKWNDHLEIVRLSVVSEQSTECNDEDDLLYLRLNNTSSDENRICNVQYVNSICPIESYNLDAVSYFQTNISCNFSEIIVSCNNPQGSIRFYKDCSRNLDLNQNTRNIQYSSVDLKLMLAGTTTGENCKPQCDGILCSLRFTDTSTPSQKACWYVYEGETNSTQIGFTDFSKSTFLNIPDNVNNMDNGRWNDNDLFWIKCNEGGEEKSLRLYKNCNLPDNPTLCYAKVFTEVNLQLDLAKFIDTNGDCTSDRSLQSSLCTKPQSKCTSSPTYNPTRLPTTNPSDSPTQVPTYVPSSYPSESPTSYPSISPVVTCCISRQISQRLEYGRDCLRYQIARECRRSNNRTCKWCSGCRRRDECFDTYLPTPSPSTKPTVNPSGNPSQFPSYYPSVIPTSLMPTYNPSEIPSQIPSNNPTPNPTKLPTNVPSKNPTKLPSKYPTNLPSKNPTKLTSKDPTTFPTINPSNSPTNTPSTNTNFPSANPTKFPSTDPSKYPSTFPSVNPSNHPSSNPTNFPSVNPTNFTTNYSSVNLTLDVSAFTVVIELQSSPEADIVCVGWGSHEMNNTYATCRINDTGSERILGDSDLGCKITNTNTIFDISNDIFTITREIENEYYNFTYNDTNSINITIGSFINLYQGEPFKKSQVKPNVKNCNCKCANIVNVTLKLNDGPKTCYFNYTNATLLQRSKMCLKEGEKLTLTKQETELFFCRNYGCNTDSSSSGSGSSGSRRRLGSSSGTNEGDSQDYNVSRKGYNDNVKGYNSGSGSSIGSGSSDSSDSSDSSSSESTEINCNETLSFDGFEITNGYAKINNKICEFSDEEDKRFCPTEPTISPTIITTMSPVIYPTQPPTNNPDKKITNYGRECKANNSIISTTNFPTEYPTHNPNKRPTNIPTQYPTQNPNKRPTNYPTQNPSFKPRTSIQMNTYCSCLGGITSLTFKNLGNSAMCNLITGKMDKSFYVRKDLTFRIQGVFGSNIFINCGSNRQQVLDTSCDEPVYINLELRKVQLLIVDGKSQKNGKLCIG